MDLGITLIPSEVPEVDFEPILGEHLAQVTESNVCPSKSGNGHILRLKWEIITGIYENRTIFTTHNIINSNATAQNIGQRELADMCEAMGHESINDSDLLHYIPIFITLIVKEDKTGKYRPSNEISKYRSNTTTKSTVGSVNAQSATAHKRPWSK